MAENPAEDPWIRMKHSLTFDKALPRDIHIILGILSVQQPNVCKIASGLGNASSCSSCSDESVKPDTTSV
jgi:hypothetical protein